MISTDTSANVIQQEGNPQQRAAVAWSAPRTLALAWLVAYLGASGAVLLAGGHPALATLHLLLIAASLWAMRRSGRLSRLVGDLLPLIVAPLLYGEIPRLIATVGSTYHDAAIQRLELAVFGTEPSGHLAAALPIRWLSELLHAGYLAYYLVIFIPPLLLLWRGERRGFGETVLAMTVAYTLCWTIYVIAPVEGPRYLWGAGIQVPDGPFRRLAVFLLAEGSSRGAAFPSSHMTVTVVQALMAWRWQRGVAWVVTAIAALVGIGAVYGGFHYAIDMVVGGALGCLIAGLTLRMSDPRVRARQSKSFRNL